MLLLVCEPENSPEITTSPTSICCTSGSYRGPTLFFCTSLVDIMTLLQKKIIEIWDYSFQVSKLKGQGEWPSYYYLPELPSLVHENGGYWYVLADRAYFGRHQPVLTGNGVFGRRARSNPPLSAQTRQSGNSGKSLAGTGMQSTISSHCPPIPTSLGTQAKIEERIWRALAGSRLVPPL